MATPYEDLSSDSSGSTFTDVKKSGYSPTGETGFEDPDTATITGSSGGGTTTIAVFTGAGTEGIVPDPNIEDDKFLRDDGSWASVSTASGGADSFLEWAGL